MLYEKILKAQNGDIYAKMNLINAFMPVLTKYSSRLHSEDAKQDFILFFIELIPKIPDNILSENAEGKIVNYITNSLKNYYYYLVKRKIKEKNDVLFSELSEEQRYTLNNKLSTNDNSELLIQDMLKSILNRNEYEVIYLYYFEQYTILEIARKKQISRQAVNQTRIRALKKLYNSVA